MTDTTDMTPKMPFLWDGHAVHSTVTDALYAAFLRDDTLGRLAWATVWRVAPAEGARTLQAIMYRLRPVLRDQRAAPIEETDGSLWADEIMALIDWEVLVRLIRTVGRARATDLNDATYMRIAVMAVAHGRGDEAIAILMPEALALLPRRSCICMTDRHRARIARSQRRWGRCPSPMRRRPSRLSSRTVRVGRHRHSSTALSRP